jgi:putative flippase GtrA
MRRIFEKYREIIMYLVFGVLTTAVGMGSYFLILFAARSLGVSETSGAYNGVRAAAQVIQWVLAVLFAYYTNKKWVFGVKEREGEKTRMASFFASRLFSLGCDSLVTFGVIFALSAAKYKSFFIGLPLGIKLTFTADLWAKLAAAVVVIVVNYVLSKFIVFKKREKSGE